MVDAARIIVAPPCPPPSCSPPPWTGPSRPSWPAPLPAAGARVEALCPPARMLARSRHPVRRHRYSPLAPMDSLASAIAAAKPDLIIPCDDLAAELVARRRGGDDLCRPAWNFWTRAAEAGAPAAASHGDWTDEDQLEDAMRRAGPAAGAEMRSQLGRRRRRHRRNPAGGARRLPPLRSQSRLRNLVARAARPRARISSPARLIPVPPRISAQRFIDGTPATSSIACWQGEVVAAHHFDVLRVHHAPPARPA